MLPQVGSGLSLLLESLDYSRAVDADTWEFSVEWPELQRLGLNCNHGRWLIANGLVLHAHEITEDQDEKRRFVSGARLNLRRDSCFVLTQQGYRLACRLAELHRTVRAAAGESAAPCPSCSKAVSGKDALALPMPKWDRDRRQLFLGNTIVKEFKLPATNQEVVLTAFEEEHWPPRIDDPLPPCPDIVPQRRLHNTIHSLNRCQQHRLLRFGADGLNQGIRWELAAKRA